MMPFFKFTASALIPLAGVRFLCRLGQVIAIGVGSFGGFVGLGGFGRFLCFRRFVGFAEIAIVVIKSFLCILKINAEKEINKEIVFFK